MALRAGYHGVKKSVLDAIAGMAGSKIIKSIGDGLKLTNAGKLSCDIDTDTMMFKSGKLASKGGLKYKLYKGTGTEGNSTSIDLGDNPSQIVALLQLGNHANGYTLFCIGFGGDKCKACWIVPGNNAISGNNLNYSVENGVLTLSGVTDVSQRADYLDMDYIVVYV